MDRIQSSVKVGGSMSENHSDTNGEISVVARSIADAVSEVIVGGTETIHLVLVALFAKGHILLEDVPGTGKTLMARTFAKVIGGEFSRIQFTPDLMPSDVIGLNFFSQKHSEFEFKSGPIMNNIVLADEINRATPRTQSALLEAMGERTVTVDGNTMHLPEPFVVLATQNPIDQEGTFPLPEAQLDRFLMKIKIGYPDASGENQILERFENESPLDSVSAVTSLGKLSELSKSLSLVNVDHSVRSYIVNITRATREHPSLELGASPRSSLMLFQAARASAAIYGRDYVNPSDVKQLIKPVLEHRLVLSNNARLRGSETGNIIDSILSEVPVPVSED